MSDRKTDGELREVLEETVSDLLSQWQQTAEASGLDEITPKVVVDQVAPTRLTGI